VKRIIKQRLINHYEENIFDTYFIGITSMAHCHPGSSRYELKQLSITECADKAYEMLIERRKRLAQTVDVEVGIDYPMVVLRHEY